MNQEIEARVRLTFCADASIDAPELCERIAVGLGGLSSSMAPGVAFHSAVIESIREEAAIYGTDETARPFIPAPFPVPAAPVAHAEPEGLRNPYAVLGAAVAGLHGAVSELLALYQGASICEAIQPASLAACYPASLDEWAVNLSAARDDLASRGGVYEKLAALGFSEELGGGGCVFLSTYRNGAAVWLTCEDGPGYPTPDSWAVGVYPPPGPDEAMPDALWLIASDALCEGEAGAARMLSAVTAAIATAEALGIDGEDYSPGDDPCPVNRCPKSRCPDSCDHGERGAR